MLLPPPERAESAAALLCAAKRVCSADTSRRQARRPTEVPAEPLHAAITQPSRPAAQPRLAPSSQAGVHASPARRDKYSPVLAQYRPATLQAWAALTMPSGIATDLCRRETITNSFSCAGEYQWQLACALSDELQLRCATPGIAASHISEKVFLGPLAST